MNITLVSCCILQKRNKILVTSRPPSKPFSGFYEFPGGKLEKKESFYDAVIRELNEELGIKARAQDLAIIDNITHSYKNNHIVIMAVFLLKKWSGLLKPRESQEIQWLLKSNIRKLNFLDGSKIILERLNSNFYNL